MQQPPTGNNMQLHTIIHSGQASLITFIFLKQMKIMPRGGDNSLFSQVEENLLHMT